MYMKPVQVMLDEELPARLDATEEVRREGRSAVLRKAIHAYLRVRRATEVREQYHAAYGEKTSPPAELAGWDDEGVWPEE